MTTDPLTPQTVFVTRYVASHAAVLPWYERLFGRAPDTIPVDNCREWDLGIGVLFQVIEDPDKPGRTEFAFAVADLDREVARLRSAGLEIDDPAAVDGFATLRYAATTDPEGVPTGLLDGA